MRTYDERIDAAARVLEDYGYGYQKATAVIEAFIGDDRAFVIDHARLGKIGTSEINDLLNYGTLIPLQPNRNLLTCSTCGGGYLPGTTSHARLGLRMHAPTTQETP
jgi:hypothetical protein